MDSVALASPRAAAMRKVGAGLVLGSMLIWSGVGHAAPPPQSFSGLAKTVSPAVVNIASSHEMRGEQMQMPDLPFNFPEGSPFEKFFRQFRDRQGEHGRGHPRIAQALGSGFIIDPAGYVVTNNHVIDGATDVTVRLEDDSQYTAKIIGTDPQTDLALLKIDADRKLPAVPWGNSDKAEVGDWVLAVGNPFGLGGTVTAGIVSARGRNIDAGPYDDFLQIDAPINRGNSGGPLFNLDGQIIGINTAIYSPNGGSVGIGFAIPSNMAKAVIDQLRDTGSVERGWLGVRIQKVTPEIAGAMDLKHPTGALVTEVTPDSPAAEAGLRQGDVVLDWDGHKVDGSRELARLVGQTPAGKSTEVALWRDGARKTVQVVTGKQPEEQRVAAQMRPSGPSGTARSEALKAELARLTPALRAQFDIADDVEGVLVVDVEDGPALKQGLRPGDVIRRVDDKAVTTPQQVEGHLSRDDKAEKPVLMLVSRQGQDMFLGLKLVA